MAETTPLAELDLRASEQQIKTRVINSAVDELSPYSPEWAKIVKPVTCGLLWLIGLVMLSPFFILMCVDGATGEKIIDWAKTVLPPVVGFGGALVGYYFGTRGTQQVLSSDE